MVASTWPLTSTSTAPSLASRDRHGGSSSFHGIEDAATCRLRSTCGGRRRSARPESDPLSLRAGQPSAWKLLSRPLPICDLCSHMYGTSTNNALTAESSSSRRCGLLGADPGDQHQADGERANDRAQGVGRVDACPPAGRSPLPARPRLRKREGSSRPTESQAAEWPTGNVPGLPGRCTRGCRKADVDRPIGDGIGDHVGRPGDAQSEQNLAPTQRQPRTQSF